jgi:hypothetical protein
MLISRARYERDMASLRAETARLLTERDTAREERDTVQAAARAKVEQVIQADANKEQLVTAATGERLIEGGRTGALTSLATLAARDHERAIGLQKQLDILQAAVLRCTCGGAA